MNNKDIEYLIKEKEKEAVEEVKLEVGSK